jgi:tRNA threonylcarbamoyladenosine biosynthesis protein TsaE
MPPEDVPDAWSAASSAEAETEALGARLAPALARGDVVALDGDLGAGKTRFVAGLARGLDAKARVRSPTFTLVNEYRGRIPLRHVDLYRLDPRQSARLALELEDGREDAAWVIEWAERLPPQWLDEALRVRIDVTGADARAFHATARGPRARALLAAWRGPAESGARRAS